MKKYLFLSMALILTHGAFAETTVPWTKEGCESVKGTWITAHSATDSGCDAAHCNGKSFCRGPLTTTWFSALIWCQSIGHKLVSFSNLCPGIPTEFNTAKNACANVSGISNVRGWTSMPSGTNKALCVNLSSGAVGDGDMSWIPVRNNAGASVPVCEE